MNNIVFLLLVGLGWGGLAYFIATDHKPVETQNCADLEFERDSLKIENNRWIEIMDSLRLK